MQCCSQLPGGDFAAVFAGILLNASVYSSSAAALQRVKPPDGETDVPVGDGVTRLALLLTIAFSTQHIAVFLDTKNQPESGGLVIHRPRGGPWEIIHAPTDGKFSTAAHLPPGTIVFCLTIHDKKIELGLVSSAAADLGLDHPADWFGNDPLTIHKVLKARDLLSGEALHLIPDWQTRPVAKVGQAKIELSSVVSGDLCKAQFVLCVPSKKFTNWPMTTETLNIGDTMLAMHGLTLGRTQVNGAATLSVDAFIKAATAVAQGESTAGSIIGQHDDVKVVSICNCNSWDPSSWSESAQLNYMKHFEGLMPGNEFDENQWQQLTDEQKAAAKTMWIEDNVDPESNLLDQKCWTKSLFFRYCAFLMSLYCCSGGHLDTMSGRRSCWSCLQRVDAIVQNGPTRKYVILCDGTKQGLDYVAQWSAKVARSEDDVRATIVTLLGFVELEFHGKQASAVGTLAEIKTLIDDSHGRVAAFVVPPGCMYFLRAGTWHFFINVGLTFSFGHDLIVSEEAKTARVGFSTEATAAAVDAILPCFIDQVNQGCKLPPLTDDHVRKALLTIALAELTPEKKEPVICKKTTEKPLHGTTPYRLSNSSSRSSNVLELPLGGEDDKPLMNAWWVVEQKGVTLIVLGWATALLPLFGDKFSRVDSLMEKNRDNVLTAVLNTPGKISASLAKNVKAGQLENDWLISLGDWLNDGWSIAR